jgi:hypothetical protein
MRLCQRLEGCLLLGALTLGTCSFEVAAQTGSTRNRAAPQAETEERDGQHDFDFQFGRWKAHNRRLLHPLTGSNEWVEFDSTIVARPIWGGRANMDEFEADTPSGHIEGMTVRTYNPKSHQWSIYWANQANGVFSLPATVGKFKNGRGEFYDQEDFKGRNIFVRYLWTLPSADTTRWEQAFSVDGGKTWETNWIITATREQ